MKDIEWQKNGIIWNSRILIPLFVILTALYIIFFKYRPAEPGLVFLFDFFYLIIFPGFTLSRLILGRTPSWLEISSSLLFGFSLFYFLLIISSLTGLGISVLGKIIPVLEFGFIVYGTVIISRRTQFQSYESHRNENPLALVFLAIVLAACTIMILRAGDPLLYTGDSQDHIAYIRAAARSDSVFPDDFLYRNGGILTRDIRKGLAHPLWAALCSIRGFHNIVSIWKYISLIATFSIMVALYTSCMILFGKHSVGIISCLLFILFYHNGLRGYQLITNAYGFSFGRVFYLLFLAFIPSLLRINDNKRLVLASLAAFCAVATHNGLVVLLFLIFSIAGIRALVTEGRKRGDGSAALPLLKSAAWIFVACAPYMLLRYFTDYFPNNPIHQHLQGLLFLSDTLAVVEPLIFYRASGVLFILSCLAIVLLFKIRKDKDDFGIFPWAVAGILLLSFNPFTVIPTMRKILYLIFRLEFAAPSMIICSYFIVTLWTCSTVSHNKRDRAIIIAGWITAALFLVLPLTLMKGNFAYGGTGLERVRSRSCLQASDLFEVLDNQVEDGNTILSDPVTSYCIPAFSDLFVVCTYDQHSVPNDSTAVERIIDCRDAFSPHVPMNRIVEILEKYDASYIAVNGRIPSDAISMYWQLGSEGAELAASRFIAADSIFRNVYEKDLVWLFEYTGSTDVHGTDTSEKQPGSITPGSSVVMQDNMLPSGIPSVSIVDVRHEQRSISPGDTFRLDIDWVRTGEVPAGGYIAFLRFDTDYPKGRFFDEAYSKLYRKLKERINGMRYRYRFDFMPRNGMHPVDQWPLMYSISDRVELIIPTDIVPGEYTISVKMMKIVKTPNYNLRDLLSDDDVFSGEIISRVRIE